MPRTYVALDLETTGLNAEKDTIIEVGAVKYRDGRWWKNSMTLVNPGRPIPYEITLITGIRNEDVLGKPSFERIAAALERFVGGRPLSATTSTSTWGSCAPRASSRTKGLDTWELASVLLPALPFYSLGASPSIRHPFACAAPGAQRRGVTGLLFEILCERSRPLPKGVLAEIVRLAHRSSWPLGRYSRRRARAGRAESGGSVWLPPWSKLPSAARFRRLAVR